jgi:hypothetical protein
MQKKTFYLFFIIGFIMIMAWNFFPSRSGACLLDVLEVEEIPKITITPEDVHPLLVGKVVTLDTSKLIPSSMAYFFGFKTDRDSVVYLGETMGRSEAKWRWNKEVAEATTKAILHESKQEEISFLCSGTFIFEIMCAIKDKTPFSIETINKAVLQRIVSAREREQAQRDKEIKDRQYRFGLTSAQHIAAARREEPRMHGNADTGNPFLCREDGEHLGRWVSNHRKGTSYGATHHRGPYSTCISHLTPTYWLTREEAEALIEDIKNRKIELHFRPEIKEY